jgi:small-conductance mechanosensitive channel
MRNWALRLPTPLQILALGITLFLTALPGESLGQIPSPPHTSVAPQEVFKMLETVAAANPGVLKNPPPKCLFTGFGDSAINFELRAWTDQFDNSVTIRSELATAVYDAVYAAGMSFPFPQREVRVLRESDRQL